MARRKLRMGTLVGKVQGLGGRPSWVKVNELIEVIKRFYVAYSKTQ